MFPEDIIDDVNNEEENRSSENEMNEEEGTDSSVHSEYKVPVKDSENQLHLSGMYQNWFLDYAS